jgi:hypothetical protein
VRVPLQVRVDNGSIALLADVAYVGRGHWVADLIRHDPGSQRGLLFYDDMAAATCTRIHSAEALDHVLKSLDYPDDKERSVADYSITEFNEGDLLLPGLRGEGKGYDGMVAAYMVYFMKRKR